MNPIVVDASVAAKWVLPRAHELLADEAAELLNRYAAGEVQLIVPDLFWAEMGNLVWKAVRLKRFPADQAQEGLSSLIDLRFPTRPTRSLLNLAFSIASAFDRTVYDSLYVALAVSSKSQLLTADEKLANALAAKLPVKWLGAYH